MRYLRKYYFALWDRTSNLAAANHLQFYVQVSCPFAQKVTDWIITWIKPNITHFSSSDGNRINYHSKPIFDNPVNSSAQFSSPSSMNFVHVSQGVIGRLLLYFLCCVVYVLSFSFLWFFLLLLLHAQCQCSEMVKLEYLNCTLASTWDIPSLTWQVDSLYSTPGAWHFEWRAIAATPISCFVFFLSLSHMCSVYPLTELVLGIRGPLNECHMRGLKV